MRGSSPRPVDHLDDRPAPTLDGPGCGDHRCRPSVSATRRAGRDQHHRGAVPSAALHDDIHGRPGGRPLLPVGLVVGIQHHRGRAVPGIGAQAAARVPTTTAAPAAARSQPSGMSATVQPRPPEPAGQLGGPCHRRHQDQDTLAARSGGGAPGPPTQRREKGPATRTHRHRDGPRPARGLVDDLHRRRPRATPDQVDHPRLGADCVAGPASAPLDAPDHPGGDAVPRKDDSGPAHRHAAHSASRHQPRAAVRLRSRRPGLRGDPGSPRDVVLDHPGPDPSSVELDPDPAAHPEVGVQGRRHGVVEPAVDGRYVRHHPHDPDGRLAAGPAAGPSGPSGRRCAQRPSACFTSCAREVSSQVNSLSDRPKCP